MVERIIPDELVVQDAVTNEGFFGMKIFIESLSDDSIRIHTDTQLFEHRIDVCAQLLFTAFMHH